MEAMDDMGTDALTKETQRLIKASKKLFSVLVSSRKQCDYVYEDLALQYTKEAERDKFRLSVHCSEDGGKTGPETLEYGVDLTVEACKVAQKLLREENVFAGYNEREKFFEKRDRDSKLRQVRKEQQQQRAQMLR